MSAIRRLIAGFTVEVSLMLLALIYVRVGLPIMSIVPPGPFTQPVDLMRTIVPIVIGGSMLFTALWIIFGSIQTEEQQRRREVRR
jgi:hypothetical protein